MTVPGTPIYDELLVELRSGELTAGRGCLAGDLGPAVPSAREASQARALQRALDGLVDELPKRVPGGELPGWARRSACDWFRPATPAAGGSGRI